VSSQHDEEQTTTPEFDLFVEKLQRAIDEGWVFPSTAATTVQILKLNGIETLAEIRKVGDGDKQITGIGNASKGAIKQSLTRIAEQQKAPPE